MPKTQNKELRIANTTFRIGDILEIVPKPDADAPSGFIEHGTTKLLMEGIAEHRGVPYDESNQMWDTGFDEFDSVLKKYKTEDRKKYALRYNQLVKVPYENKFRQLNLDGTNDEFWGSVTVALKTGRRFNTSNEKELFELYIALIQGYVCEVGEKDSYLQRSAKYCIRNIEQAKTVEDERIENKYEASSKLFNLIENHTKKDDSLYTILEWCNIKNMRDAELDVIKKSVLKSFENSKIGHETAKRFLEAYEKYSNSLGKEEMEMFSVLNQLYAKRAIEYRRRQYFLGDILLGNHLKEAAQKALVDTELKSEIELALEKIYK